MNEVRKVALGENKEKTGAKDVVSKPFSSKDIGASRMKITASAAEKFIDKLPDSGDSNTSASPSESEFEDAGDDPATFAVVVRLKN